MKRTGIIEYGCAAALLSIAIYAYAQTSTTVDLIISLSDSQGLTVTASSVNLANQQWTPANVTSMRFDGLTYDAVYKVYRPANYYVADIAAQGYGASWTVEMTSSSTGAAGSAITVSMVNQITDSMTNPIWQGYPQGAYVDTNHVVKYTLTDIHQKRFSVTDGWLRGYIGLYTGGNPGDAWYVPNATALTLSTDPTSNTASLTVSLVQ